MMTQAAQCIGDDLYEVEDFFDFQDRSSYYQKDKCNLNRVRQDMFHHEIVKKEKKHSISFRDQVSPNYGLVDIMIVENWKDYNINQESDIRENCSCNIQ